MKKTAVTAFAFVVALALGASACGGDDSATPADPQAAAGKTLVSKSCSGCHSTDGSRRVGPTLKGLAGSQVQLANGTTVTADDAYLARAIDDPDAEIVKDYNAGTMTRAVPKGSIKPEETAQIVAYLKTLK